MQLTPFYVVISLLAVAVMILPAWRLLYSTLSRANTILPRWALVCIELMQKLCQSTTAAVTEFFREHVEIAHDVWHSFSVCSDLVANLHHLASQSATPKQQHVCVPVIDDELVERIAQQVSDMHREYDRDPIAYRQKLFAELPATPAQGHTVTGPDELASVSVCSMPRARSSTLKSPDLGCIFTSYMSEEDRPDENSELLNELIAARTQLSSLFESIEGLVSTIEQSLPYKI